MKEFVKTKDKGQLYIDKVLFESNIPILFVCKNKEEELFLCVCCQSNINGKKWLISSVDEETLILLLSDKISIRDAFLRDDSFRISVVSNDSGIWMGYDESDWQEDSVYLPKRGAFMETEEGEYEEELEYYNLRQINRSYRDSFENILSESEALSSTEFYTVNLVTDVLPDFGNHQFSGNYINTIWTTEIKRKIVSELKSKFDDFGEFAYNQTDHFCMSNEKLMQVMINCIDLSQAA